MVVVMVGGMWLTLLAAELVMSIQVSAALCQNTPTVLLQLKTK